MYMSMCTSTCGNSKIKIKYHLNNRRFSKWLARQEHVNKLSWNENDVKSEHVQKRKDQKYKKNNKKAQL